MVKQGNIRDIKDMPTPDQVDAATENVLDDIFERMAAEMVDQYSMADVSVETQQGFPHYKIYHKAMFEDTAPENTKEGHFFSMDMAVDPSDELVMVVYQSPNQRICGSKVVKRGGPVYCRCLNQDDGVGFPYVNEGGKAMMGDTPRDCSLCPHNNFHVQGKDVVLLPPLNDDAKCKSTKLWAGVIIHDVDNITLATVTPALLLCGAGAMSKLYRKEKFSWWGFSHKMQMSKPNPLPWHSAVVRITTQKFKFEAGSTHLPMFEVIAGGPRVFTPMKAIVTAIGQRLMLSAGSAMDVKALSGMVAEPEDSAPTMTGPAE